MAVTLLFAAAGLSYADKPGTPVEVVNGPTNPVPVIQLGTPTVNLSSSNNNVVVVNPTNKPVLVRQVDSGALQPVSTSGGFLILSGDTSGSQLLYTVPSGKRLVIEYFSFDIDVPPGETITRTMLRPDPGFDNLIAIPHFTGNGSAGAIWQSSQLVKYYAEAGQQIFALVFRDSTVGVANGRATMAGYLVDVP